MAEAKFEVAGEKYDLRLQLRLPIVWWLGHPPLREPSHFFPGKVFVWLMGSRRWQVRSAI